MTVLAKQPCGKLAFRITDADASVIVVVVVAAAAKLLRRVGQSMAVALNIPKPFTAFVLFLILLTEP